MKRILAACLTAVLLLASGGPYAGPARAQAEPETADWITLGAAETSYRVYRERYADAPRPAVPVELDLFAYTAEPGSAEPRSGLGEEQDTALYTAESGWVEWSFQVQEAGVYALELRYLPAEGKGSSIVRHVRIDGQSPFDEAANVSFPRAYKNSESEKQYDLNGNQIRPSQMEDPQWETVFVRDALGLFEEPLGFYLTAGTHTLRLESVREPMFIGGIRLCRPEVPQWENTASAQPAPEAILLEGEDAARRSDSRTYPISDRSSAATSPSSSSKILLNTIGGDKWTEAGQWLEWTVQLDETQAGLYNLGIKARQSTSPGQASSRRLYVDGKEVQAQNGLCFPYQNKWDLYLVGDDEPLALYLSPGRHTIRLEVSLGDMAPLIEKVKYTMTRLNRVYLNFLMVVGPAADQNRDYDFAALFPDELAELRAISDLLYALADEYIALNGSGGAQSQQLESFAWQLRRMCDRPERIAGLFQEFVNNISALGTWINGVMSQPLEIDYLLLTPPGEALPSAAAGFGESVRFSVEKFIYSFLEDYETVGMTGDADTSITVWTFSGRDQANAINQLIVNDFSPGHAMQVNLQLVPAGTLLPATMAGKGPDVALSVAQADPLNFAIRGAVADLRQFPDYKQVAAQFPASARTPLEYRGAAYGIPETQNFPVMIYREDILSELGLEPPDTWDEVVSLITDLQKNNMSFGLPQPYIPEQVGAGITAYAMFLYQQGGTFYNEEGTQALLDSDEAVTAFSNWLMYYNDYLLDARYDFLTRLRAGEVPIGIADYGVYNSLSVFAPELSGVCRFALVPGTQTEEGLNRSVASTVTASVLMSRASDLQAGWEFIKWWTSGEVQTLYGREIESIMGSAGRYQPANTQALEQIPWSSSDLQVLLEQRDWTVGMPEIPGSYVTPRYIDFAFKQAYRNTSTSSSTVADPGEALLDANRLINVEIDSKLQEFGIAD